MAVQQQCLAADCAKIIFFMAEGTQRLPPSVVADLLRDSMAQGQKPYLTITSGSMRPLLHVGDEVQLEPVTLADLNEGQFVVNFPKGRMQGGGNKVIVVSANRAIESGVRLS